MYADILSLLQIVILIRSTNYSCFICKISQNKATPIKNVFAPRQLAGARAMAEGKSAAFILSKAPPFAN